MKVGTHHADDGVRAAIEVDLLANYGWIATKPVLPQRMAQHNHTILSVLLLFRRKHATEDWLGLHYLKETNPHLNRRHPRGFVLRTIARHDREPTRVRSDLLEQRRLFA